MIWNNSTCLFTSLCNYMLNSYLMKIRRTLVRTGFRHGREGQLPRAPTKRGAPTNEGPRAKADFNKRSPRPKGFNALGVGPLEFWLPLVGAT
jgi:hypothetical protein